MKKTIKDLKDYLLENYVDENGDLSIRGLDFSDFDGDVVFSQFKVKGDLYQGHHEVGGNLSQGYHEVKGELFQGFQEVEGDLYQTDHEVKGNLWQDRQEGEGRLWQDSQEGEKNEMDKFDWSIMANEYFIVLAANKNNHTKEQALELAKKELETYETDKLGIRKGFVKHTYYLTVDNDRVNGWNIDPYQRKRKHKNEVEVWVVYERGSL